MISSIYLCFLACQFNHFLRQLLELPGSFLVHRKKLPDPSGNHSGHIIHRKRLLLVVFHGFLHSLEHGSGNGFSRLLAAVHLFLNVPRRAADELGYHHNALARGLARGRSDIIGFISDGVATSPFAGQVIQGAQDEAWRNGKILLVVDTDGRKDVERRTFSFMFEHQVEGIIGLATMY